MYSEQEMKSALFPQGDLESVDGSSFDFRKHKVINQDREDESEVN